MTLLKLMNIDEMGHDTWKLIQIDWIVVYNQIYKIIHISVEKNICCLTLNPKPPNNINPNSTLNTKPPNNINPNSTLNPKPPNNVELCFKWNVLRRMQKHRHILFFFFCIFWSFYWVEKYHVCLCATNFIRK